MNFIKINQYIIVFMYFLNNFSDIIRRTKNEIQIIFVNYLNMLI